MKKTIFNKAKYKFKKVPHYYYFILGGTLLLGLAYCLIFIRPNIITFAYSGENCTNQLFIAPILQKQSGGDNFTIYFKNVVSIKNMPLFSTQLCVKPIISPIEGEQTMQVSLFGGAMGSKYFKVVTPKAPTASLSSIDGVNISTIRPLVIPLSSNDSLYNYTLKGNNGSVACDTSGKNLSCDISALKLAHKTEYTLGLYKDFAHSEPIVVAEARVTTLAPNRAISSTISDSQVIYDKPTSFGVVFDHSIETVSASLTRQEGDKNITIPTTSTKKDAQLTLGIVEQLVRSGIFTLTINKADGIDGSSLTEPIVYHFTTSAGPKVSSVSIGASGIASNAQIIVTLDQPIDSSVDINKFALTTGVTSSVRMKSPTQIAYTLQNAPQCTAFKLQINKGLKSGVNDESSVDAWSYGSRIACGTSSVIGHSVSGRPIIAYTFGSGAASILFTGGIHGTEQSSTTTMQAWVAHLQVNGYKIPDDKRVVVVPNTNPDGIAQGTRNNSHDVNIDRNFATNNWSASIDTTSGTLPQGGGVSPASEPETQALVSLTQQLRPRLEVSFHAKGSLVGANKYADSVAIGDIYASTVRYGTMYYNSEDVMGYAMTGEYEDWMGEKFNIPAILIELPSQYGNYINSQLNALWKMINI